MSERKRKLDSQRQKREPRAMFDVRPEPLHADTLHWKAKASRPPRCYNITSQREAQRVNRSRCARDENSQRPVQSRRVRFTQREMERSAAQRPSRSQVAAKPPSSSNRPISPANNGSTPTPLTTLASRIRTPIQPSPRNTLDERTGTM